MKKLKKSLLALAFASLLAGNLFATGGVLPASSAVAGTLSIVFEYVVSFLSDGCPVRQCTGCRPNDVVDDHGNCRPREN